MLTTPSRCPADPALASCAGDGGVVAGAVAVGLLFANRRLGIAALVLAVVMAFTRVYVGAPYPADVLAGLLLGGLVSTLGWFTIMPTITKIARWLSTTPLRPLVTTASPSAHVTDTEHGSDEGAALDHE